MLAAAASRHDVWLLFRADQEDRLVPWLRVHGLSEQVRLVPVAVGNFQDAFTHSKVRTFRHYWRWQRAIRPIAAALQAEIGFDVIHHATYATFYTPVGIDALDVPMVWGPVGGANQAPLLLWWTMGWKGVARDLIRLAAQTLLRRVIRPQHNVRGRLEVLAQNVSTAKAIGGKNISIVPNGTSVNVEDAFEDPPGARDKVVVSVSRLISWKGTWLAINAMRHVQVAQKLRIYSDGPDLARLVGVVEKLGLEEKVEFAGLVPRAELLKIVRHSGVLLHPALRDEAPLAVGEAMSLGAPVVLLTGSGAHEVAATWADGFRAVKPSWAQATARRLAVAIDQSLDDAPPVLTSPRPSNLDFSKEILWAYQRAADLP